MLSGTDNVYKNRDSVRPHFVSNQTNDIVDATKVIEEVIKNLEGSTTEIYDTSETIFMHGDTAKKKFTG